MKRILCVLLVLGLILSFAGCKQDKDRELYNLNLDKYVELGDYMGIRIDTKSDDFKEIEETIIAGDVSDYDLYVVKKEGKVEKGETVNIDYEGKKDGVAFAGGTAKGYNLTIGSGQFIDGFEDGLIGKEVGTTVDLNLTFPENYGNDELNGADVVFTVKINSAKTTTPRKPEDFYKDLGCKDVEEYYLNVRERAIEESVSQTVLQNSKVKDYPKTDVEAIYQYYYDTTAANVKAQYQMEMADYLKAIELTEEEFKKSVTEETIKPLMDQQMVWYAILDKEGMAVTDEEIEAKIKEILAQSGDTSATRADVIDQLGEIYLENIVISEKVFKLLKENAAIS